MKSARVLFVDTETVWRGGQEQLCSLVLGLRERGHEVALAAPAAAPLTARIAAKGVLHYPFEQRSELSPAAFFRLRGILRSRRFDLIHFNTPRAVLIGSLASRWTGRPVRVCSRRVNFPLKSPLSRLKYNLLLDGIVTVSESIRETLLATGIQPELVHVVYEGVDLNWLDNLRPPGLLNGCRRPRVGVVAHLSEEKGHRILITAIARLKQRFPNASYILVGEGRLRSELESEARRLQVDQQILFTGFRTDSEALMKELDIFCLPSLSEGLSSAILCAMASSLPVVSTGVGGIPELVVDGATGFLVEAGDSSGLAAALAKLLASEELRKGMGRDGRRRIERYFTLEQKLNGSERFYESLMTSRAIR